MPGKRLLGLEKFLGQVFSAKKKKTPDPHRRHREQAKKLAAQHTIAIERLEGGGMNVWPPSSIADPIRDKPRHSWRGRIARTA